MNKSLIPHPTLVALQGRLKSIIAEADALGRITGHAHTKGLREIANQGIAEIDQWITTKQAPGPPQAIDAEFWLAIPPAQLYGAVDELRAKVAEEAVQALDSHITAAIRVRFYLQEWLNHGSGEDHAAHRAGVKVSNKRVEQVRRLLGYSYPKQDLSF